MTLGFATSTSPTIRTVATLPLCERRVAVGLVRVLEQHDVAGFERHLGLAVGVGLGARDCSGGESRRRASAGGRRDGSRVVCMLVNMWCSCGVHVGGM